MKMAEEYGFLPTNDGEINAKCLQQAVNGGGDVYISTPGIYSISDQIMLSDNTSIYFCAGSYLKRENNSKENGYVFVNEGAYTRTYNKNIKICGLKLICNNVVSAPFSNASKKVILGLRGQLSFFYVKNITIENMECLDLPASDYCIQICTFENAVLEQLRIEGLKDAVHFGPGSKFVIRHGLFRTFDDPIALNAHDYATANPEMGWISDGIVEDCYDLNDDSTTGFFCRILAGSWVDWYEGMIVQRSDTVVSNGRLYRVNMPPDGRTFVSITPPIHESGNAEYDGITWAMSQERVTYSCGCRNIHFRDIYLQKKRPIAFSVHFDKDAWSRSFYPNSDAPVQQNITFEHIVVQNDEIPVLLQSTTPLDNVRFVNCELKNNAVILSNINTPGIIYPNTKLLFIGTSFSEGIDNFVICEKDVSATLSICSTLNDSFHTKLKGDIKVKTADINVG